MDLFVSLPAAAAERKNLYQQSEQRERREKKPSDELGARTRAISYAINAIHFFIVHLRSSPKNAIRKSGHGGGKWLDRR